MKLRLLIISGLSLLGTACAARQALPEIEPPGMRWERVIRADNHNGYVDKGSLSRSSEGYLEAWLRRDYSVQQKTASGKMYRKSIAKHLIDCDKYRLATTGITYYIDPKMEPQSYSWPPDLASVLPETVGEVLVDSICKIVKDLKI